MDAFKEGTKVMLDGLLEEAIGKKGVELTVQLCLRRMAAEVLAGEAGQKKAH